MLFHKNSMYVKHDCSFKKLLRLISFSMKWQLFNKISDELLKHVLGQVYGRNTSLK